MVPTRVRLVACLLGILSAAVSIGRAAPRGRTVPIQLQVDLSEAPRRIVHTRMTIPVRRGRLTLLYPKWLPGEHGPTGPITDLAGLKITAAGRVVPWQRDPLEMFAFSCDVPSGAHEIEVALDYLLPAGTEGFSSGGSSTEQLAVLSWNQVLLYPRGVSPDDLVFKPRVRLPAGWKYATALATDTAATSGDEIVFAPVSLTTLVDSPLLTGRYFRRLPLAPDVHPPHEMDIAADSPAALEMSEETRAAYNGLVQQATALFDSHHYGHYRFLLTLSDHVARFGLEHHESSDDRSYERALTDPDRRMLMAGLLPHELVHSWNGKYRRPEGLATGGFYPPMRTEMLWVYEGLTTYLGDLLTARSGLWTPGQYRDNLALDAATMQHRAGRSWRPLGDTATAAQLLYEARDDWRNWRRGTDFYPEGGLIWLEADTRIRELTGGRRSLDDFCRLFYGGSDGRPEVRPYTFDDLVEALEKIAPSNWADFFHERIDRVTPRAPLHGIEASGWRLTYTDTPSDLLKARQQVREILDLSFSLGVVLEEDGTVQDVDPTMPAAKAGMAPGMKLVAINGRRFAKEVLHEALRTTREAPGPLELLADNGGFMRTFRIDYHEGERYPHLEREASAPDVLSRIIAPR
ncbi:MAG: M61 family metallopeptidase [Acidobacteriota bacterium]